MRRSISSAMLVLMLVPGGVDALARGSIAGVVKAEDGTVVAGVCVEARYATVGARDEGGVAGWSLANRSGRYEIADLARGPYVVGFAHAGCGVRFTPRGIASRQPRGWIEAWHGGADSPRDAAIVHVRGGRIRGIDAVLRPQAIVRGTIRTIGGRPVAGMYVYARSGSDRERVITDARGRYRVSVDPGAVVLDVRDTYYDDFRSRRFTFDLASGDTLRKDMRAHLHPAPDLATAVRIDDDDPRRLTVRATIVNRGRRAAAEVQVQVWARTGTDGAKRMLGARWLTSPIRAWRRTTEAFTVDRMWFAGAVSFVARVCPRRDSYAANDVARAVVGSTAGQREGVTLVDGDGPAPCRARGWAKHRAGRAALY